MLRRVSGGATLGREEARAGFAGALVEDLDQDLLGQLLTALAQRGEAPSEIAGAADALRDAMVPFEHDHPDAIDTCGTGGDGLGTFNISTASAIVAAAAGARVVKHGNRAASSKCGSADLLVTAGLPLDLTPDASRTLLDEIGIAFLFAPAYHPALRFVAPIRRALKIRTVFNLVGPLANPGRVRRQLIGVPEAHRVDSIASVLTELGAERGYVVHGAGGADELTLAGPNRALPIGNVPVTCFDAAELGLAAAPVEALAGGDAETNVTLLHKVLDQADDDGAQPLRDAVCLNAGAALVVADLAHDARGGLDLARETLSCGAARDTFRRWIERARELGGAR